MTSFKVKLLVILCTRYDKCFLLNLFEYISLNTYLNLVTKSQYLITF